MIRRDKSQAIKGDSCKFRWRGTKNAIPKSWLQICVESDKSLEQSILQLLAKRRKPFTSRNCFQIRANAVYVQSLNKQEKVIANCYRLILCPNSHEISHRVVN